MAFARGLRLAVLGIVFGGYMLAAAEPPAPPAPGEAYSFIYMTDLHTHVPGQPEESLKASCAQIIADGEGAFLVTGGDYDNYLETEEYIDKYLLQPLLARGLRYPWYAVVGNHDPEWTANEYKRNNDGSGKHIKALVKRNARQPWIARRGPASRSNLEEYKPDGATHTTFSFDYGDDHFVVLDLYSAREFDFRWQGAADPELLAWLEADLAATKRRHVFVFAHEPVKPFTGVDVPGGAPGPIDPNDCIAAGDPERLWNILKADPRVVAWVCGHSHRFGLVQDGALWQVAAAEEWARMRMFMKFIIDGDAVTVRAYHWAGDRYVSEDFPLRPATEPAAARD